MEQCLFKKKKTGPQLKIISNPATLALGGMFHGPVILLSQSKMKPSLLVGSGKNQYGNIRARLIKGFSSSRGHWGATAFKCAIQHSSERAAASLIKVTPEIRKIKSVLNYHTKMSLMTSIGWMSCASEPGPAMIIVTVKIITILILTIS